MYSMFSDDTFKARFFQSHLNNSHESMVYYVQMVQLHVFKRLLDKMELNVSSVPLVKILQLLVLQCIPFLLQSLYKR